MIKCFVVDIDGCVADNSGWKNLPPEVYFSNAHLKTLAPRDKLIKIIQKHMKNEEYIVFCTGREEKNRPATEKWLDQYVNTGQYKYSELLLRPNGMDFKKLAIWKAEQVLKLAKTFKNITVYEDTKENLMMIGQIYKKAKLILVDNEEFNDFDWWER